MPTTVPGLSMAGFCLALSTVTERSVPASYATMNAYFLFFQMDMSLSGFCFLELDKGWDGRSYVHQQPTAENAHYIFQLNKISATQEKQIKACAVKDMMALGEDSRH